TEQLAQAEEKAKQLVSDAGSEANKVRIAAVKKAEGLLKEAEQKKAAAVREAERLRTEAQEEATRLLDEAKRELEVLVRRREDINAEISRVQDVLEALESFESPGAGGSKEGGVKAAAAVGATRSSGKQSGK
ncbi:hypothetical protein AB0K09_28490, partial [Streptomyces sp. NPDC049577]